MLTSGTAYAGTPDVLLYRDAAGILAQRNGTNAQSLRVANTWTSASNYEYGVFDWQTTANTLTIGATAQTGTVRPVAFVGSKFTFNADTLAIATDKTPASAAATCTAGDMHIDDNYIYVCTAANTYKRAALSTW
jgi:hypothetical protein